MQLKFLTPYCLFIVLTLLTACATSTTEMSRGEFVQTIRLHQTETINNVWYAGRKDGFDYYVHNTAKDSRHVKLRQGQIFIKEPFTLSDDKKDWKLVKGNTDMYMQGIALDSTTPFSPGKPNLKNP